MANLPLRSLILLTALLYGTVGQSLKIVSRSEWGAAPPKKAFSPIPVPSHVVIHHSAGPSGSNDPQTCINIVRGIQRYHQNVQKWNDIGYNFLVGSDGRVYEGRGWGKVGAHASGANTKSIGICLLGNYMQTLPSAKMISVTKELIAYGVSLGKIAPNYRVHGHRDVSSTDCPGGAFYSKELAKWPRFVRGPVKF